jgi:hypothetical protein
MTKGQSRFGCGTLSDRSTQTDRFGGSVSRIVFGLGQADVQQTKREILSQEASLMLAISKHDSLRGNGTSSESEHESVESGDYILEPDICPNLLAGVSINPNQGSLSRLYLDRGRSL